MFDLTIQCIVNFGGNEISLLREDLLPLACGGNKVRIAQKLVAGAQKREQRLLSVMVTVARIFAAFWQSFAGTAILDALLFRPGMKTMLESRRATVVSLPSVVLRLWCATSPQVCVFDKV